MNDRIELGIKEGFLNSNDRLNNYFSLFNRSLNKLIKENNYKKDENSKEIKFYKTIIHDIDRSFSQNKLAKKNKEYLINLRNNLEILLCNFFLKFKNRNYFQGFNSIAEILYLNYGKIITFNLLDMISILLYDQYMLNNLSINVSIKINKIKELSKIDEITLYNIIKNEFINKSTRIYIFMNYDIIRS